MWHVGKKMHALCLNVKEKMAPFAVHVGSLFLGELAFAEQYLFSQIKLGQEHCCFGVNCIGV